MEHYRIQEGIGLYFLTFTVIEWLPIFIAEAPCKIITDSLNYCHTHKHLRTNAFVIMPTHLHLIIFDAEFNNQRLTETIRDMRKFTGQQLLKYSANHLPKSFCAVFSGTQRKDRNQQFWQESKHPVGLMNGKVWRNKVHYIHDNPRRKGLVYSAEDWRFSSAGYWLDGRKCDVVLSEVDF